VGANAETPRELLSVCPKKAQRRYKMRKCLWLLAALSVVLVLAPAANAAPLFGDVPDVHWARDAVANLAAKGLVEGYPDGTYKGDRAATRYEMAMVVARLLAKMEQEHATFATKADLEELRKLVMQLRDELDALGVRVTNLEENVAKLDKRVTELERITFYGELDTWWVSQGFKNKGLPESRTAGAQNSNYNNIVGAVGGSQQDLTGGFLGGGFGAGAVGPNPVVGVHDLFHGRILTNGTGFTSAGILGIRTILSDELDAGMELAAYVSAGDAIVDAFYGASAPYLSNPFTGQGSIGAWIQPSANTPWTRLTLDNFWVKHKPTGIRLIAGAYDELQMDGIVYKGAPNPNIHGPKYLDNYGFKVDGKAYFLTDFTWEAFYTKLADSQLGNNVGVAYNDFAYGFDVNWSFTQGNFKLNFLRAANDHGFGAAMQVQGIPNNIWNGGSMMYWVNPPGWYNWQVDPAAGNDFGEKQPIPTAPTPVAAGVNDGTWYRNFGPQGITKWGASFHYKWEPSKIRFFAEYGYSTYRPNMESSFSRGGSAFRVGLGWTTVQDNLDLDLEYVTTDAWYDPMVLRYPSADSMFTYINYWRYPSFSYYPFGYQLHDSDTYPNNRQGFKFEVKYRWAEDRGLAWAEYGSYQQKTTSIFDVRVAQNAIAANVPNAQVLGYTPGFIDPVFTPIWGYSQNGLNPIEDPRGKITHWGIGVGYEWPDSHFKGDVGYVDWRFYRPTSLAINQNLGFNIWNSLAGAAQANVGALPSVQHIDFHYRNFHIGFSYPFSEKFTGRIAWDDARIIGHYDPVGYYGWYALNTLSSGFNTVDTHQSVPSLGFDYKVGKNTQWNFDLRFYNTTDAINIPANQNGGSQYNPFSWNGIQLSTEFKVKF